MDINQREGEGEREHLGLGLVEGEKNRQKVGIHDETVGRVGKARENGLMRSTRPTFTLFLCQTECICGKYFHFSFQLNGRGWENSVMERGPFERWGKRPGLRLSKWQQHPSSPQHPHHFFSWAPICTHNHTHKGE